MTTQCNGFDLVVEPSVMHPKIFKSGKIFSDYLMTLDLRDKKILDMGTGSGILALIAAAQGAEVTATDLNPTAVQCASENVRRNGLDSEIEVLEGDLFAPITERDYDVILFNPPYFDKRFNGGYDLALYGGEELSLVRKFASQASSYLDPNGYLLLITSSDSPIGLFLRIFEECNYRLSLLYTKKTLFEEFSIYKFTVRRAEGEKRRFVCPSCRGILIQSEKGWECKSESILFPIENDIPDFILPTQRRKVERFLSVYHQVRRREGWGSEGIEYYRKLPFVDTTGRHRKIWKLRARTFESFLEHLKACSPDSRLGIADLGAGNCWLSARLAELGHDVIAVDVNIDPLDGLGVVPRLKADNVAEFSCARATFDCLPFPERSFDVIIFNASLHYSDDINNTILRGLELLKDTGSIVILDSPVYTNPVSGFQMLQERKEDFRTKYGIVVEDDLLGNFLSYEQLSRLKNTCVIEYTSPKHGLSWALRPAVNKLFGRREPPEFPIIIVKKLPTGY
jgi:HemK-related putative methylase